MGQVALDTSVLVALDRGQALGSAAMKTNDRWVVSVVVLAELLVAAKSPKRTESARARTEAFLELIKSKCEIQAIDEETAGIFAELRAFAISEGKPRGVNDLWIAASAIRAGAELWSVDQSARFDELPGLRLRH
jgi:tRNA(fMet)-specific endonuclease VapC